MDNILIDIKNNILNLINIELNFTMVNQLLEIIIEKEDQIEEVKIDNITINLKDLLDLLEVIKETQKNIKKIYISNLDELKISNIKIKVKDIIKINNLTDISLENCCINSKNLNLILFILKNKNLNLLTIKNNSLNNQDLNSIWKIIKKKKKIIKEFYILENKNNLDKDLVDKIKNINTINITDGNEERNVFFSFFENNEACLVIDDENLYPKVKLNCDCSKVIDSYEAYFCINCKMVNCDSCCDFQVSNIFCCFCKEIISSNGHFQNHHEVS